MYRIFSFSLILIAIVASNSCKEASPGSITPGIEVGITDPARLFFINRSFNGTVGTVTSMEEQGFDEADGRTLYSIDVIPFSGNSCGAMTVRSDEDTDDQGFGKWGGVIYFPKNLEDGDELFIRYREYIPSGYQRTTTNWVKNFRIGTTLSDEQNNRGYLDWQWGGSERRWLFEPEDIVTLWGNLTDYPYINDTWYTVNVWITFDSSGKGVVRTWINNDLILSIDNQLTLWDATDKVTNFKKHTTWNGTLPVNQTSYIDDLTITSDRTKAIQNGTNWWLGI